MSQRSAQLASICKYLGCTKIFPSAHKGIPCDHNRYQCTLIFINRDNTTLSVFCICGLYLPKHLTAPWSVLFPRSVLGMLHAAVSVGKHGRGFTSNANNSLISVSKNINFSPPITFCRDPWMDNQDRLSHSAFCVKANCSLLASEPH